MARTATNARTASEPDWIRLAWRVHVTLALSTVKHLHQLDTSCPSVLQEACCAMLFEAVSIVSVLRYSGVPIFLFQPTHMPCNVLTRCVINCLLNSRICQLYFCLLLRGGDFVIKDSSDIDYL